MTYGELIKSVEMLDFAMRKFKSNKIYGKRLNELKNLLFTVYDGGIPNSFCKENNSTYRKYYCYFKGLDSYLIADEEGDLGVPSSSAKDTI